MELFPEEPKQQSSLWPWQSYGVERTISLLKGGSKAVCIQSPTGMGKGKMIEALVNSTLDIGGKTIVYTDRKMLTKQTGDRFRESGIEFGYASAELGMRVGLDVTVASLQTIRSRVSRGKIAIPRGDLIIVDEAHKTGFEFVEFAHREANPEVRIVGLSATPVGLAHRYSDLVIAGTKEEGRKHGALVPCKVIGMPEPDMEGVKMNLVGEYEHAGMVKRVMQCTVFADVFDTWLHNGKQRPTLLWAPGVPESRWFVEEFKRRGVNAAHIDGKTDNDDRARIRNESKSGRISVVSSFGVMREGVDWPWISYGILLQVCGAYETFCQIVGRILRASANKEDAILQDHSGTWWRHGSPNDDRDWELSDDNKRIAEERFDKQKSPGDSEPISCPKCNGIRIGGAKCPFCGYESARSIRAVRTESGELVELELGETIRGRKTSEKPAMSRAWTSCLFCAGALGHTFQQARVMFHKKTGQWPNHTCQPLPEQGSWKWHEKVVDIYPNFRPRRRR